MDFPFTGLAMGLPPMDQSGPLFFCQVCLVQDETCALLLTDDCGSYGHSTDDFVHVLR